MFKNNSTPSATPDTQAEVEKQKNRERFIAEVQKPALMENPVFDIQAQTQKEEYEPQVTCDLEEI